MHNCLICTHYAHITYLTQTLCNFRKNYAKITQKLRKDYATITHKYCKYCETIMQLKQKLRKNYAQNQSTHKICTKYAQITHWQKYAQITHKIRIHYANYA